MTDGELEHYIGAKGPLLVARTFNPLTLEATGTWRGTLGDLELLRERNRIQDARGRLEEMAKEGVAVRTQAPTAIREAVRRIVMEIARSMETGTMPGGDRIDEAFAEVAEEYDVLKQDEDEEDLGDTSSPGPETEENGQRQDEEPE